MNAIAEREVCAYELAERRRAYIAGLIKDCLLGNTETVLMSWGWPNTVTAHPREGLLEVLNDEISKSENGHALGPFLKTVLDPEEKDTATLRGLTETIIQEWADVSYECMTAQEQEALPC
ncbi:hypothetical protein LQZ44_12135 [Alcaligenes nematophilus]|uniref:hypothetical protein n=1 Tax=Alcaligenes nematophilus TaxID=2994643 RepID=UPI0035B4FBE8